VHPRANAVQKLFLRLGDLNRSVGIAEDKEARSGDRNGYTGNELPDV